MHIRTKLFKYLAVIAQSFFLRDFSYSRRWCEIRYDQPWPGPYQVIFPHPDQSKPETYKCKCKFDDVGNVGITSANMLWFLLSIALFIMSFFDKYINATRRLCAVHAVSGFVITMLEVYVDEILFKRTVDRGEFVPILFCQRFATVLSIVLMCFWPSKKSSNDLGPAVTERINQMTNNKIVNK